MNRPDEHSPRIATPTVLALAATLSLAACSRPAAQEAPPSPEPTPVAPSDPDDAAPVMRTYEVPGGRADELRSVLRSALSMGPDAPPRGRVERIDGNRMVVVAPPSIHAGIEELCRTFEQEPASALRPTVPMDTWILRVDPAGEPGESSVPSELDGVVEEILGDGPAKVSLLEKFELASSSGEWAKVDGRHARLEYRYSLDGDRIVAKIDIETTGGPSQLETTLSFEPGKYVILGRGGEGFPNDASNTSLYYVLRARQPNA